MAPRKGRERFRAGFKTGGNILCKKKPLTRPGREKKLRQSAASITHKSGRENNYDLRVSREKSMLQTSKRSCGGEKRKPVETDEPGKSKAVNDRKI